MSSYLLLVILSSYISYTLCTCNQTIIVVGAGAAGLAAAQYLQKLNCTVTVLEAQARTGGRVQTITLGGTKIDVGASWIHGIGPGNGSPEWEGIYNPIYQIAQDNNITTVPTWETEENVKNFFFEYDGTTNNDEIEKVSNDVSDYYDEHSGHVQANQSLDELLQGFVDSQPKTTIQNLRYQFAVNYNWGQNYAANARDISAKYIGSDSQFEGQEDIFPNGYEQIIAFLSKGINITMSSPVTKINYTGDVIQVTLANNSIMTSDKVIVTVPLAVLKSGSITFTPALAAPKQAAITAMGAGVMDKLLLQFAAPFWDTSLDWLDYVSDQPGQWVQTLNLFKYLNKPYLLMFNIADSAKTFSTMTDAQVLASAMTALQNMYPGATQQVAYYRTNWGVDEFEKMSYSFIGKTATEDSCEAIAEGETTGNKVFFAGEHTNCFMIGTVHGAYVSGQTAAKAIVGEGSSNSVNTFNIISSLILLFATVIY